MSPDRSKALSPGLKRRLRGMSRKARIAGLISPHLPPIACVDVGASYYPHGKWRLLLESPATRWIAVEPNVANAAYVKTVALALQRRAHRHRPEQEGGTQTLYVTNVDSGSSLLEPQVPPNMRHDSPTWVISSRSPSGRSTR